MRRAVGESCSISRHHLDGFGLQFGQRHDGIHQPHFQRLMGIVLAAQEPDFLGFFQSYRARQQTGTEARVEAADAWPGLPEAGIVGGDGQIAYQVQHVAAADGIARHHCHHWFGQAADLHLQIQHVEVRRAPVIMVAAIVAAHLLVAAGAESQVARAGKDDGTDFRVEMRLLKSLHQGLHRLRTEGVAHLGAVDGDARDPFRLVVENVLKAACRLPIHVHARLLLKRKLCHKAKITCCSVIASVAK